MQTIARTPSPAMPYTHDDLYDNRNKVVAQSFYRQLRAEGFTHEQIISLSTTLLDLVTTDLRRQGQVATAK